MYRHRIPSSWVCIDTSPPIPVCLPCYPKRVRIITVFLGPHSTFPFVFPYCCWLVIAFCLPAHQGKWNTLYRQWSLCGRYKINLLNLLISTAILRLYPLHRWQIKGTQRLNMLLLKMEVQEPLLVTNNW